LGALRVSANGGIQVDYGKTRFMLDPRGAAQADFTFVSHAHLDHVHSPKKDEKVIASAATKELALARGYDLGETIERLEGVDLLDSGHILGSRAIRIDDELLYTGDASGRERAFLGKCKTRSARVLVMETTFGLPEYVFPPTAKVVKEVNSLIAETFDKGRPVVLMGYPLGKAQVLSYFFSSWSPLFVHERVAVINDIHTRNGIPLESEHRFEPAQGIGKLPRGPWVMISPMTGGRSKLMSALKKEFGAVLVAFSGWAIDEGYRHSLGVDHAFPLSDHCDYQELVKLVQDVSPEVIYTTHGFSQEFAGDLRKMGFSARTLAPHQSSLYDYISGD
jgi:putative mRNA 3-end processing factor